MSAHKVNYNQALIVLIVAFSAWLLTNIDQSLFGYVVPQVMADFDLSLGQISYIISLSFIAGMILPIAVGVMTDRYGARLTLPLCLGISAILIGVQGLVADVYSFSSARIISFGLSAALAPITNAIVLVASPPQRRALMVAILQCAYPLGWLLSSLLVSPLIEYVSWRSLFMIGFAVALIAPLLGWLLPKNQFGRQAIQTQNSVTKSDDQLTKTGNSPLLLVRQLFSKRFIRTTILCALAFFFYGGSVAATAFYLPTFLNEGREYSLSDSALIVGFGYGFSVIGYIGAAVASTYYLRRRDTIIIWNVLAAILFTIMLWLPETFWQDFVVFGVLGVFYYGTSAILITYVMEAFPANMTATAAAVCGTACVSASMATYPIVVASFVPSLGWEWTFNLIVTPSLLISAAAMSLLPRESFSEMSPAQDDLTSQHSF